MLARVEDIRLTTKVGYAPVYRPRRRALTVVYRGVLGELDDEDARLVLAELRREVAAGAADVLRLRNLEVGLPVAPRRRGDPAAAPRAQRARDRAPRARRPRLLRRVPAPRSRAARARAPSATRGGSRSSSATGCRSRSSATSATASACSPTSAASPRTTYQHGLGVAFAQTDVQRKLTTLTMERGWFRAYVLYLDGEPIAFWQGQAYNGVFATGVPGFDPAYADLRVGNYVLLRLIADLCADETIDTLDYGFGDAEYKRRFGTREWLEQDVHLYAATAKGLRTNAVRSSLLTAVAGGTRVLARGDRLDRLKRTWRDRLSRDGSAS